MEADLLVGLLAGVGVLSRTMLGEMCDRSNRIAGRPDPLFLRSHRQRLINSRLRCLLACLDYRLDTWVSLSHRLYALCQDWEAKL